MKIVLPPTREPLPAGPQGSRNSTFSVYFLDENAESKSIQIEDFLATVFQHELDHLIGKLYIDRMKDIGSLMFEDEMIFENTEEELLD